MEALAPTRLGDRIATLDVLRGIAICGILLMNIPEMGLTGEAGLPSFPAALNLDWIAYGLQHVLFDGTMRGLFTLLFGAGMLLMLRHAEGPDPIVAPFDVWARRCLALMALGAVQWLVLLWPGEILSEYGLCGLFLLAFRQSRPRTLLIAAAIILLSFVAIRGDLALGAARQQQVALQATALEASGKPLNAVQTRALETVRKKQAALHPGERDRAEERAERTHWGAAIGWSWDEWSWNLSPAAWRLRLQSLYCMLLGMALFRLGILTGEAPTATYLRLMLVGYGGGLAVRIAEIAGSASVQFDESARLGLNFHAGHESILSYELRWLGFEPSRILMTLGHLGLIVLVFRAGWLGRAMPLRALGRMALTTYTLQSAITSVLFYGFGLLGRVGFAGLMAMCVAIWVVTGLFCVLWLCCFAMGPVESLLRRIAYGTARDRAVRIEGGAASAAVPAL